MQMNQFLPIFLCSVNLVFYKLLFFSSSVCSAGLLCINSFCHSSLLQLLFLIFYSSPSFILHCASSSSPPAHSIIFLFSQFHSFSHTEQPTRHSLSHFLLYTHPQRFHFAFSSENERPLSKQLKRQLIGNHESVSLTDL
jgi:hypothetical protein